MSTKMKEFDAVIVGGGIVGSTLAALLGKADKRIALIEARPLNTFNAQDDLDLRVSAINRASRSAFENVGVWDGILSKRAQVYESMCVWDEGGTGEVQFDAADVGAASLGHIIENNVIQASLFECLEHYKSVSVFASTKVQSMTDHDQHQIIALDTGEQLRSKIVIGADGPASQIRELAGISVSREDYGQRGLVAVVKTEHGHKNTAWQRFLSGGPLALLPLNNNYSSIVWSLPSDQSSRYLKLSDAEFCRLLTVASECRLGTVTEVGKRAAFPLVGSQASSYISDRVVLIGDAAHTIHPLAGQGVNLGIKDAVVLASILLPLGTGDWGSRRQLRHYERARKGENLLVMKSMEGFKLLFGHNAQVVKSARNTGLNLFNSLPIVKRQIMRGAMGL